MLQLVTQQYICPNCGVSVLLFSKGCTDHISPHIRFAQSVPKTSDEDAARQSLSWRSKRGRGIRQVAAPDLQKIVETFIDVIGLAFEKLCDPKQGGTTRYYRRMFEYILNKHITIGGRPIRYRIISELVDLSHTCIHNDVAAFSALVSEDKGTSEKVIHILDSLELALT